MGDSLGVLRGHDSGGGGGNKETVGGMKWDGGVKEKVMWRCLKHACQIWQAVGHWS